MQTEADAGVDGIGRYAPTFDELEALEASLGPGVPAWFSQPPLHRPVADRRRTTDHRAEIGATSPSGQPHCGRCGRRIVIQANGHVQHGDRRWRTWWPTGQWSSHWVRHTPQPPWQEHPPQPIGPVSCGACDRPIRLSRFGTTRPAYWRHV